MAPERLGGVNLLGNGEQGCPMKISGSFINFYLLKKPHVMPFWHDPVSRWPPSEHFSTKMGSFDIEPLWHRTLCPSITSTYMFHIKIPPKHPEDPPAWRITVASWSPSARRSAPESRSALRLYALRQKTEFLRNKKDTFGHQNSTKTSFR